MRPVYQQKLNKLSHYGFTESSMRKWKAFSCHILRIQNTRGCDAAHLTKPCEQ